MRLSPQQIEIILSRTRHWLGDRAHVRLFGSRRDDSAKGGDVDLLIETQQLPDPWRQAQLQADLEHRLGLSVDLVFAAPDSPERPITRIARATGIPLT